MKLEKIIFVLLFVFGLVSVSYGEPKKIRIFVVSSYHREYLWSQDTHKGVCAALLDFKFLDNKAQTDEYTQNDYLKTDKIVIKKAWMDTKRKSAKNEIAQATAKIVEEINEFKPDLILLGDDNAVNYIGNQFIDTDIPVVFWGINGIPLKYGLLDSLERPGHNVTGVYQSGYEREALEYLKKLVPEIKTLAVLSDDSETGRAKVKKIENFAEEGSLPFKLVESVVTNSYLEWQSAALRLQNKIDAFFISNHNTLKDEQGNPVDQLKAGAWYLRNIMKPDCGHEKQFVQEGILLVVDDSGFKQGYEAVRMAYMILHEKKDPASIPVIAPTRGAVMVNRERALMLGIDLSGKDFIEEYTDKALALEIYPQ
ncbi:MAG: ABC transporter substrate binding protein [Candidatus Omnitrophota bacterium]